MGEPVTVVESQSSRPGFVRFETNRTFTGMGHERYMSADKIYGDRPPDQVARQLFETGQVAEVHVYAQTVTVRLIDGVTSAGLKKAIEDLYTFYLPGVPIPSAESFS